MATPALGVCYYPEHWPFRPVGRGRSSDVGDRHPLRAHRRVRVVAARAAGQGELHFDWLVEAMDALGRHGLKVIVGTPTATPPRWMVDRYPDMLAVDARRQAPRLRLAPPLLLLARRATRAEAARITSLLIEKIGGHPALAGWQTDNEYGCHDTTYSYSASGATGVPALARGSVQHDRGAQRGLGQCLLVDGVQRVSNRSTCRYLTVTEANPAAMLDFCRYSSDQVAAFNKVQFDLMKAARPDLPVIHNFMGATEFDHYDLAKTLDVASWDSYPIGHLDVSDESAEVKARYMRQGEPDAQGLKHDLYRAVGRGRLWIMEQQPGPVNWATYNPDPLPGMVRLWTWEAFAHGAEVVSYFRWRQYHSAQEQMHAGLLRPDSQPAPAYHEARQVAEELEAVGIVGEASKARVAHRLRLSERVGLADPAACARIYPPRSCARRATPPCASAGWMSTSSRPQTDDFSGYDLVIIPALFAWNDALRSAIADFQGHLLIGPRSGSKTGVFTIPGQSCP